jgi:hypothetical protein
MVEYYYILSSLPMLNFYGKPPLPYPEFVERCALFKAINQEELFEVYNNKSDESHRNAI